MTASPLTRRERSEAFAWHGGRAVTVGEFVADVTATAGALPDGDRLINVCEDRYRFMVAFFAVVLAGRTNLLPAARSPDALGKLAEQYPGARPLRDDAVVLRQGAEAAPRVPEIPDDAVAAVAFTSGSTGDPQAHEKRWGALVAGASLHSERLVLSAAAMTGSAAAEEPAALVATVPPWHMYGLEWTMLLPTRAAVTVYCGESFFPSDVRRGLAAVASCRVLVTTPVHLRAMLRACLDFPAVDALVCATAPLERSLAMDAEERLGGPVLEIYGCSEAGTLAHRLPATDERWRPFPGLALSVDAGVSFVSADFLPEPVALADRLDLAGDGSFRLLGRLGDLVKVAGKRASLADLTARLLSLPGVEDAVIINPADVGARSDRLVAFVVAPGQSAESIRRRLAERVDAAFLPRPLKLVPALPRSDTGKLTRAAVRALLRAEG